MLPGKICPATIFSGQCCVTFDVHIMRLDALHDIFSEIPELKVVQWKIKYENFHSEPFRFVIFLNNKQISLNKL